MKLSVKRVLSSLLACFLFSSSSFTHMSYNFETLGRFGDCLVGYSHARWLSYKYNFEFYYRPFPESDNLVMSKCLKKYDEKEWKEVLMIADGDLCPKEPNENVLYMTHDFLWNNHIDFDDQKFLNLLRYEIRPLKKTPPVQIPKNVVSVALHVRRGGGYDHLLFQTDTIATYPTRSYEDKNYPTRFPPDRYYIKQLEYIANLFPDKDIYAHIFTDDPSPELIAQKYKATLNNPRIAFGYRQQDNRYDKNVLTDFFAMMDFDCLIRAGSHYSYMAGILGRIPLEISPIKSHWEGSKLIITQISITKRTETKTTRDYVTVIN